jgi:hypothetical protein
VPVQSAEGYSVKLTLPVGVGPLPMASTWTLSLSRIVVAIGGGAWTVSGSVLHVLVAPELRPPPE